MKLAEQLKRDEGVKLKPYQCPAGKLTIGVGRNLEDNGISEEEAMMMLDNDIQSHADELFSRIPWALELDEERRGVLLNMAFNMGVPRLLTFKKTLAFIEAGDYTAASVEMLNSNWARQVGKRAERLSAQMRTGSWQ